MFSFLERNVSHILDIFSSSLLPHVVTTDLNWKIGKDEDIQNIRVRFL
jgi:hypothetical protein